MSGTLTTANSTFSLSIPDVFPTPQALQAYATDDAFSTESVTPSEVRMGVDGILAAGFTPFPTKIKIVLQANSDSIAVFEQWLAAMKQAKETYAADGLIGLPGVNKQVTLTNGYLTGAMQFSDAKKQAEPQSFEITFESVDVSETA